MDLEEILSTLTIRQKAQLLSGKDFWKTQDFPALGVSSLEVSDGPCGLRKQMQSFDHLGFNGSEPATAHVSGTALAAAWDQGLARRVGEALGRESVQYNVDILLGPAVNIERSPLCGRHFEYFSEDPLLTAETAAAYIEGVQGQGVGACIKHYAANNQETEREYIDERIDERALHEIYLAAFEKPVREARPWAVMTALNKVNGDYCSESSYLLTDVLRNRWGYDGFVMSDWWGVNDRAAALRAGLDLEMPYSSGVGEQKILDALNDGRLTEEDLNAACRRILACVAKRQAAVRPDRPMDWEAHHAFAREAAEQSIVLLKNEGAVLPLARGQAVAVIGGFAKKPRYKMEGSALVNPTMVDIPLDEMQKLADTPIRFAQGFSAGDGDAVALRQEAAQAAREADVAVLFLGLPTGSESEGHDRKHLRLPQNQLDLLEAVCAAQENVVVVLAGGGPVEMPWLPRVRGLFMCFLAGQGMGGAVASLLYGLKSPSGRLPVTFPQKLCQTPAYLDFPGDKQTVEYREGVFVGYRYYDKREIEPLFPFGFGLGYASFRYSNLRLSAGRITDAEMLTVTVTVHNTGRMPAREVVQLYVGPFDSTVYKPVRELRGFEKLLLQPQEERDVAFTLDCRAFAFYNAEIHDWYVDEGEYTVSVGSSSRDLPLSADVYVAPLRRLPQKVTGWSKLGRLLETQAGREALETMRKTVREQYCEDGLRELLLNTDDPSLTEKRDEMRLRFITLGTQTVIDNDQMEAFLQACNRERVEMYLSSLKEPAGAADTPPRAAAIRFPAPQQSAK